MISESEMMYYFCHIQKYDYAVALHIMQYKNLNDSELLDTLMNYRIDEVPNKIIDLAQSMEMFIIFIRLGRDALESYCDGYFLNGNPVTRSYCRNGRDEIFYLDMASEDYARKIYILTNEIEGYGLRQTYMNRECEYLQFDNNMSYTSDITSSNTDSFDEVINNKDEMNMDKIDDMFKNMLN
jgi:hypothetical protein